MKKLLSMLLAVTFCIFLQAQNVGIGTSTPNAKAILDISSTTKGLLIPSMSTSQRLAISSTPNGLMVYDTDKNQFYHYTGTAWSSILNSEYWSRPVTGRSRIANPSDSVGIGTNFPTEWLDVNGNIRSRNNLIVDNNLTVGSQITTPLFKLHVYDDIGLRSTSTSGAQINFEDAAGTNKNFINITGNDMKIGTLSSNDNGKFIIRTNGNDRLFIDSAGNITVGSAYKVATGYKMSVNGKIMCEELRVQLDADWPDYVFDDQYTLLPLESLQKKVMKEKHLPGIPTAAQVKESNGIDVGDMQKRLLEKVEEMYRYLFQLNNENQQLKKEIALLKKNR